MKSVCSMRSKIIHAYVLLNQQISPYLKMAVLVAVVCLFCCFYLYPVTVDGWCVCVRACMHVHVCVCVCVCVCVAEGRCGGGRN